MPSCRGGMHGNPGMREPPKRVPANRHRHTETISGNNLPENTYPDDPTQKREGGEGARIHNDLQVIHSCAFDPQRSADGTAYVKQCTLVN